MPVLRKPINLEIHVPVVLKINFFGVLMNFTS